MTEQSIGQAIYEEAQRRLLSNFKLKDWQLEDQPGAPCPEPERDLSIEVEEYRINIFSGDPKELAVWIELNAGQLVVHAYDAGHECPVTLRIGTNDIKIETDDR